MTSAFHVASFVASLRTKIPQSDVHVRRPFLVQMLALKLEILRAEKYFEASL